MANKVSFIIQLKDQFSRGANKIKSNVQGLNRKFDSFNKKLKKSSQRFTTLIKKARTASKSLSNFGRGLIKGVTVPLTILGTVALVQSAKLETLSVSLETMAGSAEEGKKLLEKLIKFTATTPFQLEGVGKAVKTLLAFKVSADEMTPVLRMLGDIAAGTSAPLSDIALIFGKARAKGKLMTEELLQLSERGIPIIDLLAKRFGVTKAKIFELASESKISFNIMESALKSMTSSGGIFFEQTIRQSKTLAGKFSTLKDNLALTSAVFGDVLVDVFGLKEGLETISKFLGSMATRVKGFAKARPELTRIIVIFAAIMALLGPLVVLISAAVIVFGSLAAAGAALSVILVPLLIVTAVVGGLVAAGVLLVRNWGKIKSAARSLTRTVVSFLSDMKNKAVSSFSAMIKSTIEFAKNIIEFVMGPINAVIDKFKQLKGFFSGGNLNVKETLSIAPAAQLKSQQKETGNSQTNIDVTLKAPENVVESTKIKSSGNNRNLNIGMNMVAAI